MGIVLGFRRLVHRIAPDKRESLLDTTPANFDHRRIKDYIVHPTLKVAANTKPKAKKVLIYGYTKWSHGRVYYDLCKQLHQRGYIVDILDWQASHADYIHQIAPYYDFFMTACDGVRTLVDSYGITCEKIIVISHHELDIRMLIEQKGLEIFYQFANYGVVSEFVYCASMMRGVTRVPMVASLGINYSEFFSELSEKLETVGYASSMSVKTYGVEWKRGDLAAAAVHAAGLDFKVAGSTANQMSFHDMPNFYKSVDAVVTSSISEAAQLPVMEAAAAGRLVIGTPVGHFPMRAYQGGGIIAPIEAAKFKAFTTEKLQYFKKYPRAYVAKCHSIQEAAQQFDWQHSIGEWVDLIEAAGSGCSRDQPTRTTACNPSSPGLLTKNDISLRNGIECRREQSVLVHLSLTDQFGLLKKAGYSKPTNLCHLMSSFGSDKGGLYHNYTVVYDYLFSEFKNERLAIFELGLGTNKIGAPSTMGPTGKPGASLRGWREYFNTALIYGADIDRDILFSEDRIRTFWVDQKDADAIRALWQEFKDVAFDIMIDDGLHESSANIRFFMESFDRLKPGGIYIIEDIKQDDIAAMEAFAASVACASNHVVYELLEHPRNNFDNRLLIIQKKK